MPGSVSSAWTMRPPQKVSAPVTRTRRPTVASAEPDAAPVAQHVVDGLLEHAMRMRSDSSMIRLFEYRSWSGGTSK